MYIFETIFATILLQTYLDSIKWSDKTVIEKCSDGPELYRFIVEKLSLCGQEFGSSLSMNRGLTAFKVTKLIDDKHPTWACKLTIPSKNQLMDAVNEFLGEVKVTGDGNLEIKVVTKYLRAHNNERVIPRRLKQALKVSGIFDILHRAALSFVASNRPDERTLFETMYSSLLSRDCFLNLYDVGVTSGMKTHRDHVSLCTV